MVSQDVPGPLPEWVSLSQVVNWLVLGERPLSGELDRARRAARASDWEEWEKRAEAFRQAKWTILSKLNQGRLTAFGRRSTTAIRPENDWNFRTYVDHADEAESIPADAWVHDGIVWVRGSLLTHDGEYASVSIAKADFLRHFGGEESESEALPRPDYTTPFLDLMFEAIRVHDIAAARQPKHEALVDWFQARTINGQPVSANQAKAMASFVRLPEQGRGGSAHKLVKI